MTALEQATGKYRVLASSSFQMIAFIHQLYNPTDISLHLYHYDYGLCRMASAYTGDSAANHFGHSVHTYCTSPHSVGSKAVACY